MPSTNKGDVIINVTYTSNGVSSDTAQTTITVQKPATIVLESTNNNASGHTCTAGTGQNSCTQSFYTDTVSGSKYTSFVDTLIYHFNDQFGAQIGLNMVINESYNPSANVIIGSGAGAKITDCFYFCSQKCRQGQTDQVTSTQTILGNGYSFNKSVTWTCSGATVQ